MQLKHIKITECPICKCKDIVREQLETDYNDTKIRMHCNGGRWEERQFACGYIVKYEPNFPNIVSDKPMRCKNNPLLIERGNKRKIAIDKINKYIQRLDVDDDFKKAKSDSFIN